ncbi:unnamed protein product [Rotaria socialis]|uniref:glutathione transferase n=1 Tax=Rotaria socialis TaxID=392032 RepID=A0A820TWS0_9BILA|nr:unnamed protein product [Rotaria socialis]
MVQSRAICRYLELKYKGKGAELIPTKDGKSQDLFEQVASTETSYFDPYASDVYKFFLSKQPYLGGQDFILADLFHLPPGAWLVKIGEGHLFESRPHVKQWWDKIAGRVSWKLFKPSNKTKILV